MTAYRFNRFECCGQKIPSKSNFCPSCGKAADYMSIPASVEWVLDELDRRADGCKKVANTWKCRALEEADPREAYYLRKRAAGNARSALFWRRMFRIVHNLAAQGTSSLLSQQNGNSRQSPFTSSYQQHQRP
jgi:hypothetical protein